MNCTSCQGQWTPPPNLPVSNCPFCGANLFVILNNQAKTATPEVVLNNMLHVYGWTLLQNEQRLIAIVIDLFAHNSKVKKLLVLSIKEKVPQQMGAFKGKTNLWLRVKAIREQLIDEDILSENTIDRIIELWQSAMGFDKPDDISKPLKPVVHSITKYKKDQIVKQGNAIDEKSKNKFKYIKRDGKYGLVDKGGKIIVPFIYEYIGPFMWNIALVKSEGKFGLIDVEGKLVIPIKYNKIESFIDGVARVELYGKFGFIDNTGKEVIPAKFDYVGYFSNNIVRVKLNGKWGYINKNCDWVKNA